jgi:sugar phosphate isomerase/epimerase
MKIGFPIHPRRNIIKEINWIGENDFDFVDLFLEEDAAVPEKINILRVKDTLKKYNLSAVGHTAWYLPTGSPVRLIRDTSIKEAEKYFRVFSQLGVRYVTIHAFWPPSLFSEREGIDFQVETLKKLVKIARKYNLNLMYEPIDTKKDTLKNVSVILNRVPSLYFHLDIGHANLYNKK